MIGTWESLVIDCPDTGALARFYGELLGLQVVSDEDGWVELSAGSDGRPLLALQRVEGDYTPPQWPGQEIPQQMHVDVRVDDLDAGEQQVLALGATKQGYEQKTFRVYLDPAGHPFCLVSSTD